MVRRLLIVPALLAAAALYAWLDGEAGIRPWLRLRADGAAAQQRIAELRGRIEAREAEARALESDLFAIERAIREDLGFAAPDEVVVKIPAAGEEPPTSPPARAD
jgi:cell division protein FtsB